MSDERMAEIRLFIEGLKAVGNYDAAGAIAECLGTIYRLRERLEAWREYKDAYWHGRESGALKSALDKLTHFGEWEKETRV